MIVDVIILMLRATEVCKRNKDASSKQLNSILLAFKDVVCRVESEIIVFD
jgi:hypothetical protein